MNRIYKSIICFLLMPAACIALQPPQPEFERLSEFDGISHFSVYTILQDHEGFMWFGSLNGLSRFDGYQFKMYKSHSTDTTSLSDDWILALHEDANGILWIGTWGGRILKFDKKERSFLKYGHPETGDHPSYRSPITDILRDQRGVLWIGTFGGGLFRHGLRQANGPDSLASQDFFQHYTHESGQNSLANNRVTKILEAKPGLLLVATFGGGLSILDVRANRFTNYAADAGREDALSGNHLVSLFQSTPGDIWIGTFGDGLSRIAANEVTVFPGGNGTHHLSGDDAARHSLRFTHYSNSSANPGRTFRYHTVVSKKARNFFLF